MATTWRALIAGKSGAAPITKFDASKFPVRFAGEVKDFNPLDYMDRKEAKRADQYTQYAVAGATQAMTNAGSGDGRNGMDPDRIGVIIGSGIGGLKSFEEQHDVYRERGAEQDLARSSSRCSSLTSPLESSRCSSTRRVRTTRPFRLARRVLMRSVMRSARSSTATPTS